MLDWLHSLEGTIHMHAKPSMLWWQLLIKISILSDWTARWQVCGNHTDHTSDSWTAFGLLNVNVPSYIILCRCYHSISKQSDLFHFPFIWSDHLSGPSYGHEQSLQLKQETHRVSLCTLLGFVSIGIHPRKRSQSLFFILAPGAGSPWVFRASSSCLMSSSSWWRLLCERISEERWATLLAKVTTWDSSRANLLLMCLQDR